MFALSFVCHHFNLWSGAQNYLLHFLYSERDIKEEIVIVGIDEASLQDDALQKQKNWSRTVYGDVIKNIEDGNPSVVMLDVLLSKSSSGLESTDFLQISKENSDLASLAFAIIPYFSSPHPEDVAFSEALSLFDNIYLIKNTVGDPILDGNIVTYTESLEPIDLIKKVVKTGFQNFVSDSYSTNTSTIYAIPAVEEVGGVTEEHIDLKIAREYLNKKDPLATGVGMGSFVDAGGTGSASGGAASAYKFDSTREIPIENGQMLINYSRKPGNWPIYSFVDVYAGRVDPSVFKDKIVLIGAETKLLQDFYFTPIDEKNPMQGIEIHANTIQMLLDGDFLRHQTSGEFLLLLAVLLIVGIAAFMYAPAALGLVVMVLEAASVPFIAKIGFGRGVIFDIIWPIAALLAAYLIVILYRNTTEFREKKKLKNAFSHYVAAELVKQIVDSSKKVELGGEKREITAMFLDIENFTTLSEKMEPQAVVSLLNFYFDALSKVIMLNGGTVDKYEGDAIMALFGAPLTDSEHARKACETALQLRDAVSELNGKSGKNLNIRIGLASGEAIIGNMGSTERFDYTAIGDTVNTASRLEGANKFYGTRILVTAGTVGAKNGFLFRKVDDVRLKGKDNAIAIFELLGREEGVSEKGHAIVADFERALALYQKSDFAGAEEFLTKVERVLPEDGPTKVLRERIKTLRARAQSVSARAETWDGIWTLGEK
jgi:class 3 adenylate cyclase